MIPSRPYYMIHLLDALRELGGSAKSTDVYDWLEKQGLARADDLQIVQTDQGTRFKKEVRWARKELFDSGLISNVRRGSWTLTAAGKGATLDHESANRLVADNRVRRRLGRAAGRKG